MIKISYTIYLFYICISNISKNSLLNSKSGIYCIARNKFDKCLNLSGELVFEFNIITVC